MKAGGGGGGGGGGVVGGGGGAVVQPKKVKNVSLSHFVAVIFVPHAQW